ncbi:MAG: hypothetical protein HZB51_27105 [Chloroflexi bacterium]|nr:hypothetical protein [Chloroflexota bacterium]
MPDFQTLSIAIILISLVITASFVILIPDWRLALYALAVQYVVVATLISHLVPLPLAIVRVISGGLALMILYFTARQKLENLRRAYNEAQDDEARDVIARRASRQLFVVGFPFRLFSLALVVVGIIGIVSSMSFLGLTQDVLFGAVWLMMAGILVSVLSRDVLRLGLGILIFTSGFCILETATEESLLLYGLLNISDLLIALVIAHLGALPTTNSLERRGDER